MENKPTEKSARFYSSTGASTMKKLSLLAYKINQLKTKHKKEVKI